MSQEKGTPAQKGTGSSEPVIQKLHRTGEGNVKIKLNASAARRLYKGKRDILTLIAQRMDRKSVLRRVA